MQPPKSEPGEFTISGMWNWSECNHFILFSTVWLWTKHQLMHKQDLLTPTLIFAPKAWSESIEGLRAIAAITRPSSTSSSSGHLNPLILTRKTPSTSAFKPLKLANKTSHNVCSKAGTCPCFSCDAAIEAWPMDAHLNNQYDNLIFLMQTGLLQEGVSVPHHSHGLF